MDAMYARQRNHSRQSGLPIYVKGMTFKKNSDLDVDAVVSPQSKTKISPGMCCVIGLNYHITGFVYR